MFNMLGRRRKKIEVIDIVEMKIHFGQILILVRAKGMYHHVIKETIIYI